MTERFLVTAGARWQTESKDTTVTHSLNHSTPTLISLALLPDTVDADLSRETDAITWSLTRSTSSATKSWGISPYPRLQVGRIQRRLGSHITGAAGVRRREGGSLRTRSEIPACQDRVQVNAAAFYSDFTDYQEAGFVALQFLVTNARAVTSKGVEMDLTAQITDTLVAELNGTYARTQYNEFTQGLCYPGRTPTDAATGTCDLRGRHWRMPQNSKLHAGLAYDRPTSFGEFYARTDYSWSDEYFTNVNHDPRHVQGAFGLLDARAGLRHWRLGSIHLGRESY